ncbi:MAG: DUF4143 domain-containing protein [Candidatus Saccharibacteria bacterium]|nr:DUF4143 domain-containing protein [Candidatus Saccharibacteria bacterium]
MKYINRIIDSQIKEYLEAFGAVLVEGPKWCGKTSSAKKQTKSVFDLGDPKRNFQNRKLAANDLDAVLDGVKPRLIDEWQEVPFIWDAVKHKVDEESGHGLYLLSGSSTPRDGTTIHSGAGRIGRVKMSTMTLSELGISNGLASINNLLYGAKKIPVKGSTLELNDILDAIIRGGWPGLINVNMANVKKTLRSYLSALTSEDIIRIDGVERNPLKMMKLLQSLSKNTASMVKKETLRRDVEGDDSDNDVSLSRMTLDNYLNILRRLYILDEIPAWYPALKSTIRLRTAPKRILVDSSLAVAALKADRESLRNDLKLAGNLFENLVLHDLLVYAQANDAQIFHYNDNSDLEVDAIIEGRDMKWGAFEIKLSYAQIDAGAATLRKLEKRLVIEKQKKPEFLAVITGVGGILHQREDGVWVIPIEFLGV